MKDGTGQIRRALLDVFYELDKACGDGASLFRKRVTILREKPDQQQQQPVAIMTSSLVDPDEVPLL